MDTTPITLDQLLKPDQVAEYLGTTAAVLAQERFRGCGLPYIKVGRRIRYRATDIADYLADQTILPEK